MGRCLGALAQCLAVRRRQIVAINLAHCFPELSPEERKSLLQKHFFSLGLALIETAMAWYAPASFLRKWVDIEGGEHLHAAMAKGKGVLLLAGHFTTLEICGARLGLEFSFIDCMYRSHKNPWMEQTMQRRGRFGVHLIDNKNVRKLLHRLKSNRAIWYAPDQDRGLHNPSVFAPFFQRPTATLTATSRIAKASGAPVLPFRMERSPLGNRCFYRAIIEPPLPHFPSGDDLVDATQVNKVIEGWVRQCPEQYFWVHRRFKTSPPGEPSLYGHL